MMKLIISICILLITSHVTARQTLLDLPELDKNAEIQADQLFEQENYQQSFDAYLVLAKLGDKYSQYMVSFQYFHGLGVEKDAIQAYSWASLAKRSKAKEMKDYYEQVKSTLSGDELELAEKAKAEISEKYTDLAVAIRLKKMIRNTIPKCGGSRMRGNCSVFMKHFCVDNGSKKSYDRCLQEIAIRNPKAIQGLKQDLAKADAYIENILLTGGSVTSKEVSDEVENEGKD